MRVAESVADERVRDSTGYGVEDNDSDNLIHDPSLLHSVVDVKRGVSHDVCEDRGDVCLACPASPDEADDCSHVYSVQRKALGVKRQPRAQATQE